MGDIVDIGERREEKRFKYEFCGFTCEDDLIELKLNSCDFKATMFEDSVMLSFGDDMAVFLGRDELAQFGYVLGMCLDYEGETMLKDTDEVLTIL